MLQMPLELHREAVLETQDLSCFYWLDDGNLLIRGECVEMLCTIFLAHDLAQPFIRYYTRFDIGVNNGGGVCVACYCHVVYLLSWDDFYKSSRYRKSLTTYNDGLTTFDLYAHEYLCTGRIAGCFIVSQPFWSSCLQ